MADEELDHSEAELPRSRVTILFTDIKGATSYFERYGDAAGKEWAQHHNEVVYPIIQENDGHVVKILGGSTMVSFRDNSGAIKAAAAMQSALKEDRAGKSSDVQIHVRIAIHTGRAVVQGDDIFGEVVSETSRILEQSEPGQILVSDFLVDDARDAGFQCANLGQPLAQSGSEPLDIYAVAWSDEAGAELIEAVQERYERKLESAKRRHTELEEEFERARDSWRSERRKLAEQIEHFEDEVVHAKEGALAKAVEERQAEIRFELEESARVRQDLQNKLEAADAKWQAERTNLKTQIASMHGTVIEALERSNNPSRTALAVREQVDARLIDAKQEWQLEFEIERRQLQAEIARLKRIPEVAEDKKETARRAVLERLGKAQPSPGGPAPKTADQWEGELENAKIQWEAEKGYLNLKVQRLETELHRGQEAQRNDIQNEVRAQYEIKLTEATQEQQRLSRELEALKQEFTQQRELLTARIEELERTLPEAQSAVRSQVTAELSADFEARLDEAERLRARAARTIEDTAEELEAERRRSARRIEDLEDQVQEAKQAAARAQRRIQE